MHSYEWMVSTLLKVTESTTTPSGDFIQRIAIHLLNALSCQVDYSDKRLVGVLGAFPVIFSAHMCSGKCPTLHLDPKTTMAFFIIIIIVIFLKFHKVVNSVMLVAVKSVEKVLIKQKSFQPRFENYQREAFMNSFRYGVPDIMETATGEVSLDIGV